MAVSWIWLEIQIAVAVLVILLLRQGMRKLPRIYSYGLWLLVFARLLCPVSVESRFGFMPSWEEGSAWMEQRLQQMPQGEQYGEAPGSIGEAGNAEEPGGIGETGNTEEPGGSGETRNGEEPGSGKKAGNAEEPGKAAWKNENQGNTGKLDGAGHCLGEGQREQPAAEGFLTGAHPAARLETKKDARGQGMASALWWLAGIWLLGIIVILGANGLSYVRICGRLKNALWLEQNVYVSGGIRAPFTLGLVHPRIYLPKGLGQAEQEYILCHEQVHIRRRDYLVKNAAFFLTAIHWFNPFVWVAFFFLGRDMEMSCDEKVIRLLGTDIKKEYSQSLLDFATGKQVLPMMMPLTFGANGVKQRIKNVLSYQNAKRWSICLGILILLAAGILLFTVRTREEAKESDVSGTGSGAALEADGIDPSSGQEKPLEEKEIGVWLQNIRDSQTNVEDTADQWVYAFMNRDMDTLAELASDKESFLARAKGAGEESIYGSASPWTGKYCVWGYSEKDDRQSDGQKDRQNNEDGNGEDRASRQLRIHLYKAEPEAYVMDLSVELIRKEGFYYVEDWELKEHFSIDNKEQLEELYGREGAYDFGQKNTGYNTDFYRYIFRHLLEGTDPDTYACYTDPLKAAVRLLHLGPGEGTVRINPASWAGSEEMEPWMKLMAPKTVPEGSRAAVFYTFEEDGSTVEIPMELLEASTGLWGLADTGTVRQVYQTKEVTDHAVAEYFGWKADEPFYLQVSQYGLYRLDPDGGETCIYPYAMDPNTVWALSEGLLYVSLYETPWDNPGGEGYPNFWNRSEELGREYHMWEPAILETIGILDLRTGEYDTETLRLPWEVRVGLSAPLGQVSLEGGFVQLYRIMSQNEKELEYSIPLVNTGSTNLTIGTVWNGFPVAELEEGGRNAYGTDVRQRLLEHPGMLLELGNRTLENTHTFVDLDGDGIAEQITLSQNREDSTRNYWPYDSYRIQAGESQMTGTGTHVHNGIWAFSPDGSEILLALCEDGPKGNPETTLYAYRDGELVLVDNLAEDIRKGALE